VKRQGLQICLAALLVIGAAAVFLATWQKRQRLGQPGVRIVNQPSYAADTGSTDNTNTFLVSTNSLYLPERVLDFESNVPPISKKVCEWLPKDTTYGQRFYRATNGFGIQAMTVLMGKDRTSIHKPHYCLTSQGWSISGEELTAIPIARPMAYDLPVMKLTARQTYQTKDGQERSVAGVFVYWFVADKQLTAKHDELMWRIGRDLLRTGVLQRWAYVTWFSTCAPGQEEMTYARMREFIAAAVPEFQLTPSPAPGGDGLAAASVGSGISKEVR
jgi:hypothetical protein